MLLAKGPNLVELDPVTGQLTRLFHPRRDDWHAHFTLNAGRIVEQTPVGRTTVQVLQLNLPERVQLRVRLEPEVFGR